MVMAMAGCKLSNQRVINVMKPVAVMSETYSTSAMKRSLRRLTYPWGFPYLSLASIKLLIANCQHTATKSLHHPLTESITSTRSNHPELSLLEVNHNFLFLNRITNHHEDLRFAHRPCCLGLGKEKLDLSVCMFYVSLVS